jgi:hypothetical protein
VFKFNILLNKNIKHNMNWKRFRIYPKVGDVNPLGFVPDLSMRGDG